MFRIREHLFHFTWGECSPVEVDEICHYDSVTWSPERRIQLIYTLEWAKMSYFSWVKLNMSLQERWHRLVDNRLHLQVKKLKIIWNFLLTPANQFYLFFLPVFVFTVFIIAFHVWWYIFRGDEKRNLPGSCRSLRLVSNNFNSSLGGIGECPGNVEIRENTTFAMKNRTDLSVNWMENIVKHGEMYLVISSRLFLTSSSDNVNSSSTLYVSSTMKICKCKQKYWRRPKCLCVYNTDRQMFHDRSWRKIQLHDFSHSPPVLCWQRGLRCQLLLLSPNTSLSVSYQAPL